MPFFTVIKAKFGDSFKGIAFSKVMRHSHSTLLYYIRIGKPLLLSEYAGITIENNKAA